jgi:hypothetical protein
MESTPFMNFFFSAQLMALWVIAVWVITAVVHVGFACAVLIDTGHMERRLRCKPFLVGGIMWALATLLGGVFVAAIYWLIHHSTLRPAQQVDAPPSTPSPSN